MRILRSIIKRNGLLTLLLFSTIVVGQNKTEFNSALELFGEFIDSGTPFALSEIFSAQDITLPAPLKKALDKIIIIDRSFAMSLDTQTAELQFVMELFGQVVVAKLRMGLEYPGPQAPTKSIVPPAAPPQRGTKETARNLELAQEGEIKEQEIRRGISSAEERQLSPEARPYKSTDLQQVRAEERPKSGLAQPSASEEERISSRSGTPDIEPVAEEMEEELRSGEIQAPLAPPPPPSPNKGGTAGPTLSPEARTLSPEARIVKTPVQEDKFGKAIEKMEQKIVKDIQVVTNPEQTVEIFKKAAIAKLKSVKPKFSLLLGLPTTFKLSAVDSRLKFLDILQFSKFVLVLSQTSYNEKDWGIRVSQGLNLAGTLKVAGPIERVAKLAGERLTELTLQGLIDPAIVGSKFSAIMPGQLHLGNNIRTTGLVLMLYLKEVGLTLGISTGLAIKVPKQDTPLFFIGEIAVAPEKASFEFYMDGMWENVFGIPGPKIGNVKFKATTDYTVAAATGGILTLSGLGIGGEMGIGSKSAQVNVYGEISTTEDIMVEGAIKGGIYLEDIVGFSFDMIQAAAQATQFVAKKTGRTIDTNKLKEFRHTIEQHVPNLGFESAHISLAPKVMWFGGKKYDGVEFDLLASVLEKKVMMHMKLDKTGIEAQGALSKITVGPITIAGATTDKKKGMPDDGPMVSLIIKPASAQASLFLSGRIDADILGGFSSETLINISPAGLQGRLRQNLFNQFKINFELSARLKDPKDFFIKAQFEQEALSNLEKLLETGSVQLLNKARQDLEQARGKVKTAQETITNAQKEVEKITKMRKKIEEENKKSIARARAKAQEEVARYEKSKAELKAQIQDCKGHTPKGAAAEIEESGEVREPTPEEKAAALEELKRMGLNKEQVDAVANQIKEGR